MTTTTDTLAAITSEQFEMEVKEGLLFILNHTDGLWPRTVSTYATKGAQVLVNNFAEAMAMFRAAYFLDCRISAYPKYTNDYINRTGIAPSVLLVDIDKKHKTAEEFELTVTKTYTNFHNILGCRPTQLWTGDGIHYLTPQQVPVFEKSDKFSKFYQPSRRFMQFEEQLLTDGKGDQSHWSTVSFNNCMLRIPFSLNSSCINFDKSGRIIDIPYNARVMIDKRWDGNMPTVGHVLIMQYYTYLQFAEIRDRQRSKEEEQMARRYGNRSVDKTKTFQWIEKLLNKPLDVEGRYYCVWRIFAPYLINVKRLSRFDAFNIISTWLDKCNSLRRLSFSSVKRHKIDYALNNVGSYWPVGRADLEQENNLLYQRLKSEGIIYR